MFSMETSTPARPPATFATWLSVSDTANVEDRISSPISRWTIESWPSLARLAQKIAVNSTITAVHKPNDQAHTIVTTGAMPSTLNMISCGALPRKKDPTTIEARLPSARPAARAPRAKLCDTGWWGAPKFTLRSRKAKRNRM